MVGRGVGRVQDFELDGGVLDRGEHAFFASFLLWVQGVGRVWSVLARSCGVGGSGLVSRLWFACLAGLD